MKTHIKVYMDVSYPDGSHERLEIKNIDQVDSLSDSVDKGSVHPKEITLIAEFPQKDVTLEHDLARWSITEDPRGHAVDVAIFAREALFIRDMLREWIADGHHPMMAEISLEGLQDSQIAAVNKALSELGHGFIQVNTELHEMVMLPHKCEDGKFSFPFLMSDMVDPKRLANKLNEALKKIPGISGKSYEMTLFQVDSWTTPEDYMRFSFEVPGRLAGLKDTLRDKMENDQAEHSMEL